MDVQKQARPQNARVPYGGGLMYKRIRNGVLALLCWIWGVTFGISFFGIWSSIILKIFMPISGLITIWCLTNLIRKRYIYLSLGVCSAYLGIISLIGSYKLAYFQYEISAWCLLVAILMYIIILLLILYLHNKHNKNVSVKKKNSKNSISIIGIAMFSISIVKLLVQYLKSKIYGDPNVIAVPITITLLLLCALFVSFGFRYIIMDDSELFSDNKHNL